jgi:hypothetical protein
MAWGRFLLTLIALLFCAPGAAHAASRQPPRITPSRAVPAQDVIAKLKQKPLIMFVAKGEPNACGPGCSEWIAADGNIDPDAADRVRAFLEDPARRKLPVFFNSLGGATAQAATIGLMLREYRMTAGVGRTIPEACRRAREMDAACRNVARSKPEHRARLVTGNARCASGCVYAILGASVRRVGPPAELGIHSARWIGMSNGPPVSTSQKINAAHDGLRSYALEMGVEPALIDAAAKVSSDSMHWMTRSEIDRFGLETRGFYETSWRPLQESSIIFSVAKSWTQPDPDSAAFHTSVLWLRCWGSQSIYLLIYRRELPLAQANSRMVVRLEGGGTSLVLSPTALQNGRSFAYMRVERDAVRQLASVPKLTVTEFKGSNAARAFEISTAGLADAVTQLQKRCDLPKKVAMPATLR